MNIEVFVTPRMKRDLKGIKAARECELGEKCTLREVYHDVLKQGIESVVSGLVAIDDDSPEYRAYLKASGRTNEREI